MKYVPFKCIYTAGPAMPMTIAFLLITRLLLVFCGIHMKYKNDAGAISVE